MRRPGPAELAGSSAVRASITWLLAAIWLVTSAMRLASAQAEAGLADAPLLAPGEFQWTPQLAPVGPLLMVISLDRQLAHVYRNGVRIGVSTISSGRPGHETPSGIYTVLQKRRIHYSNLYDDAPMPFMQRLTWDGIALHAGNLPGYPASHGCIRLPAAFAEQLFAVTDLGMTVVIGSSAAEPQASAGPPLQSATGNQPFVWQPELAPEGPLSVVLNPLAGKVLVFRNGVQIGSASIRSEQALAGGTHAFMVLPGEGDLPSRYRPGQRQHRWLALSLSEADPPAELANYADLQVDPAFAAAVLELLRPGTVLVITDQPMTTHGDAGVMQILESAQLPR